MSFAQVCILGDSWITRLEAYCKSAGIAEDLGCRNLKVSWMGKGGMRWPFAMADLERLSKTHHPDVIILHCGGNDLGATRTVSLMLQMKEGLENLLKLFPNSRFLFSEVCQRQKWQFGAIPGSKLEKSRKRLNKEVTTLLHLHGMEIISHANISFRDEKQFLRDGVHLTPEGNAVFLRNIQRHFAATLTELLKQPGNNSSELLPGGHRPSIQVQITEVIPHTSPRNSIDNTAQGSVGLASPLMPPAGMGHSHNNRAQIVGGMAPSGQEYSQYATLKAVENTTDDYYKRYSSVDMSSMGSPSYKTLSLHPQDGQDGGSHSTRQGPPTPVQKSKIPKTNTHPMSGSAFQAWEPPTRPEPRRQGYANQRQFSIEKLPALFSQPGNYPPAQRQYCGNSKTEVTV